MGWEFKVIWFPKGLKGVGAGWDPCAWEVRSTTGFLHISAMLPVEGSSHSLGV